MELRYYTTPTNPTFNPGLMFTKRDLMYRYVDGSKTYSFNPSLMRELLLKGYFSKRKQYKASVNEIVEAVCEAFNVPREDLNIRSNKRTLVYPRQMAWYLIKDHYGVDTSYENLGDLFGGYTHANVMHGIKTVRRLLTNDRYIVHIFDEIKEILIRQQI